MKEVNAPNCGRENDLIGYLYGELSETESRAFQSHVQSCQSCNTELSSLQNVRESVVAWRNESLAGVTLPAFTDSAASIAARPSSRSAPSALAAFREFFNLAPLWLKGAVAFASVLFCVFAGLAVARLLAAPAPVMVANSGNASASEEQVKALVEQRVNEELQRRKAASEPENTAVATADSAKEPSHRRVVRNSIASSNPIQRARRPLSKTERDQLAADLRLVSALNDSEIDLLDDSINQ